MAHVKFIKGNPYVYESYRAGIHVRSRYLGRLNKYLAKIRGSGTGVVPSVNITKSTSNPADISVSMADISNKMKFRSLRTDVTEVEGKFRNKDVANRNADIEYARILRRDEHHTYQQISDRMELSGPGQAHKLVNRAKPKPEFYIEKS